MASAPIPSVVAMLICDQIITEQVTNKRALSGFDKFFSPNFPAMLPRLAVYVKLADALGGYLFRWRIVKLKDESAIAEIRLDTQIPDADQYTELALNMPPLLIPEQGNMNSSCTLARTICIA